MRLLLLLLLSAACAVLWAAPVCAAEIDTAFALVQYQDEDLLKTFNKKVGRSSYGFSFGGRGTSDIRGKTRKQLNQLVGRAQGILDMRPEGLHFTIRILPSPKEVQQAYMREYKRKVDYIA